MSGALGAGVIGGLGIAPAGAQNDRVAEGMRRRNAAAEFHSGRPVPHLLINGDEERYPSRIGTFTKTLPHNHLGEVEPAAFAAFLKALETSEQADFDAIPAGGVAKLANPRAAFCFAMAGADAHTIDMPAVHALNSARQSAEAAEVYWMAMTRDVDFDNFDSNWVTQAAARDLSDFTDFTGPKVDGHITSATLFRGLTEGDLTGPYLSQFLWADIPYGNRTNRQTARNPIRLANSMEDYAEWLGIQNGAPPARAVSLESDERYITTGRHLGEYVHRDYTYQAYLNAALICSSFGPRAMDSSPYNDRQREGAFLTFGPADLMDLVARAAVTGLRPAWFHKWLVHRKIRPEGFGGRVHNHLTGAATYPLHAEFLDSPVLDLTHRVTGSYLLPQAYPEGSPTHPSYPAGHATIAGACVTVLKAIFNEGFVLPAPVVPSANGRVLEPYRGDQLTIGGELNKLASNMALGRNMAGVHWRADGDDGLVVGEEIAISLLQDHLREVIEPGAEYTFTRFNGDPVVVHESSVRPA